MISVRRADGADLDSVLSLFTEYLAFYRRAAELDRCRAFLGARLQHQDSLILVARIADRDVGFSQLYQTFSSLRQSSGFILNDLYVRQDSRGVGAGRSLLHASVQMALGAGGSFLQLETEASNAAAQALYLATGWVPVEGMVQFTWEPGAFRLGV